MTQYLSSSDYFDFEHERIQALVSSFKESPTNDRGKAVGLYNIVRDGWRYDPYHINLSKESFKASNVVPRPVANCVEKSILLISCLRAVSIPARLHLGKVKNHMAAERLIKKFGTNELSPHGMVHIFLNGKWLKASPSFNSSLCHKFKVKPLEFDGVSDSYLQQYNSEGTRFMEYTDDYGHFADVPLSFMKKNIRENYPHIFGDDELNTKFSL